MSKSLQRISENQQGSKRKETTAVKEQKLLDAFCDIRSHITLLHKEQRHRQTDKIDQNHQHDRADDRENHRNFHAILNSVNFAGSEVLAGVGRKCCAKSFKRLCKDHQDLHSSIDCHNGIGAEQVYCTLEDNTSDCCDRKLQSHWDSDDRGLTDGMEVNFPFFFLECEDVVLLFQIDDAENTG